MSGRALDGWEVISRAAELARQGEEVALATVVWRQGPSSGKQGSRAIITAAGDVQGWIGGACAEPAVIREAQRVIRDHEPRLLLLGTTDQFGEAVPGGMRVVPTTQLVVVGRSPMAHTLAALAGALGWQCDVHDGADFDDVVLSPRSIVVVATQGHGDEEAVEHAVSARPAFVGLVASARRGEAVLGYLADRGVDQSALDRVRVPVGLDLGHTSHREIAVSILAELVQLRASGALYADQPAGADHDHGHAASDDAGDDTTVARPAAVETIDPVCGMTVMADRANRPVEHDGRTYYFCGVGCRDAFVGDPERYVSGVETG